MGKQEIMGKAGNYGKQKIMGKTGNYEEKASANSKF